jgi:hypothetical protein
LGFRDLRASGQGSARDLLGKTVPSRPQEAGTAAADSGDRPLRLDRSRSEAERPIVGATLGWIAENLERGAYLSGGHDGARPEDAHHPGECAAYLVVARRRRKAEHLIMILPRPH